MRTLKTLPLALGSVAILATAFLLYSVVQKIQPTGTGRERPSTPGKPVDVFVMEGMSYTDRDGEKLRFRLKADRVEVAKRKFGIFYVNPLKEATFSNLELEVYEDADRQAPAIVFSAELVAQLLPAPIAKEFGVITRIRVDGLHITLYREGHAVSSITAQHAAIDPKTRMTTMTGDVSVAAAEGRSIRGQESTWDQAAGLFWIPGPYLLVRDGKVTQGKGLRFDAELQAVRS